MADKKITELTNITGANLVDADEFVVVDISADETKAITLGELKEAFDSGSGFVRITGDTMTGDLTVPNVITSGNVDGRDVSADGTKLDTIETNADVTDTTNVTAAGALMTSGGTMTGDVAYGDNVKATFGAGADLQIYHDGSNSYISDADAGNLSILSNGAKIALAKLAPYEFMVEAITDGAVNLYYDGSKKLATTTSGIDVTGTVVADGLTIQGTNVQTLIYEQDGTYNPRLATYFDISGTHIQHTFSTTAGTMFFENGGAVGSGVKRMSIGSSGDIGFYEDTGSQTKLMWDAFNEALEFGDNVKATFGASRDLQVYHTGAASVIGDFGTGDLLIRGENLKLQNTDGANYLTATDNDSTRLYFNGSEKLATTTSGIDVTGTVSADDSFFLTGASDALVRVTAASGSNAELKLLEAGTGDVGANIQYDGTANELNFKVGNNLDRTRISIARDSGDISFYEVTGSQAKLTWDASDEALEFGDNVKATFGASSDLQIYHDGSNSYIQDAGTGGLYIKASNNLHINGNTTGDTLIFAQDNGPVRLYYDGSQKITTTATGISVTGSVELNGWTITESGGSLYFATGGTNKMKLDASGNLDVVGSVNSNATIS